MKSFVEAFDKVQEYCMEKIERGELTDVAYRLWIKSLNPVKLDGNVACFTVQSEFQANIIIKNYTEILTEALMNVLGFEVELSITAVDNGDEEDTDPNKKKIELEGSFSKGDPATHSIPLSWAGRTSLHTPPAQPSPKSREAPITRFLYTVRRDWEKLTL